MLKHQAIPSMLIAVVTAIGCGGGKPPEASAKTDDVDGREAPIQTAQAPAGVSAPGGGHAAVQGVVRLQGTPPGRQKIQMAADPVCQQKHPEPAYGEAVIVNDNGTLRNVFVYVKEGVTGSHPAPSEPVVLDQAGCLYSPHVGGIQVGQPLEIVNSDDTLHNVNAKPSANRPFNIAQPVQGMKASKQFTTPEIMVRFKCNVHPWMSAYLGVLNHPFFSVTGADGTFTIAGLPDGTYVIEAWHETYGTKTQTIIVSGGRAPSLELIFSAE